MKSSQKFFVCAHCGNLIGLIKNKDVPLVCCGERMSEISANTSEASVEKHLPVVTATENGITVKVGSASHPMEDGHHIDFIYVETKNGGQRKSLKHGTEPVVTFLFADDEPIAVYAYCNQHGLWKTEV